MHKITLAPPPLIEVPVSSPESDRPCTYVGGGIEFVSASTLFRLDLGLFVLWYFSFSYFINVKFLLHTHNTIQ